MELPNSLEELLQPPSRKPITAILKRGESTKTVEFDSTKIANAVKKASIAYGINYSNEETALFANEVETILQEIPKEKGGKYPNSGREIPGVEDVQSAVLQVFDERNTKKCTDFVSERTGLKRDELCPIMRDMVKEIDLTGAFYKRYKDLRDKVRESIVNLPFAVDFDSTDKQLGIHTVYNGKSRRFDADALKLLILEKTSVGYEDAEFAVKRTEEILSHRQTDKPVEKEELISIVDTSLMERGHSRENLLGGRKINLSLDDIEQMVYSMSGENSNIQAHNPEALNLGIAELALKEYALREVFDKDVAEAHRDGIIHLHDLGYPTRVYCSAHSIEYIKKYGLDKVVANLDAKSKPANKPWVLNNHVHTFLAAIQSSYAGALGFPLLNTLYGPSLLQEVEVVSGAEYIRDENGKLISKVLRRIPRKTLETLIEYGEMREFEEYGSVKILKPYSKAELKDIAQNLVFGASQSAFSRGGQTLFMDFNIDLTTPEYVRNVPALFMHATYIRGKKNERGEWEIVERTDKGPLRYEGILEEEGPHKGELSKKNGDVVQPEDGTVYMTYGNELVKKASRDFTEALLEVFKEGDKYEKQFNFPKCDVHVGKETFEDPEQEALLRKACEVVEYNDAVYFMFDRGSGMDVAQCCRLRERISDPNILKHPEKLRFCGFQNVSINLPQAGFRAKGNTLEEKLASTFKEIDKAMLYALRAHTNKRRYIQNLLDKEGAPLRAMGDSSDDGEPYIDLQKATYIIGVIGLNELVQHLTGKELHEDAEAYKIGLKILSHMYSIKNEFAEKYKMKFVIEETPGESANRRLAKIDQIKFPEESTRVIKGSIEADEVYYTNSGHLGPDAPVSGLDRAILQAKTNPVIEAGAITHIFSGEKKNKSNAVYDFVKSIFYNTQSSQVVFSGEHTICLDCGHHERGLLDACLSCGNDDPKKISQKTRIVGYFSDPRTKWNKSKKGELKDRQKAREFYAGEKSSVKDLESELYKSVIDGEIRIGIIGMPGCSQCDRAKTIAERYVKNSVPNELKEQVRITKYSLLDENDRVVAAIYNAPIDIYPTVVVHKGSRTERFTSEYPYEGKIKVISTQVLDKMFKDVVGGDYKFQSNLGKGGETNCGDSCHNTF